MRTTVLDRPHHGDNRIKCKKNVFDRNFQSTAHSNSKRKCVETNDKLKCELNYSADEFVNRTLDLNRESIWCTHVIGTFGMAAET